MQPENSRKPTAPSEVREANAARVLLALYGKWVESGRPTRDR